MAALGSAFRELDRFLKREVAKTANSAVRNAALTVVNDLQTIGPYWDGLFYNAWEVREGTVDIPADQQGEEWKSGDTPDAHPRKGSFTLDDIPNPRVTYKSEPLTLTIGNRMEYRDIALDLKPGRIKKEGGGTADQDWYTTYYAGGEMDTRVKQSLQQRISLPD